MSARYPAPPSGTPATGHHGVAVHIAIDIDSTLHDHWPLVAAAAKRRFGVELPYEEQVPGTASRLSDEQLIVCIEDTHTDEAIAGARPYPHAVETINRWHEAGHPIAILTHRAERSLAATRRWLDDIGLHHDGLWAAVDKVARSRELGVDLLIDDIPDTLLRALDAGLRAATLRHPWNEHLCGTSDVICAADWRELARVV
jgi:uncharacterized protein